LTLSAMPRNKQRNSNDQVRSCFGGLEAVDP
jgi:hypothetical protein